MTRCLRGRPAEAVNRALAPLDRSRSAPRSIGVERPIWGSASPGGAGSLGALSHPCCTLEDVAMRTAYDYAPLFRSSIGFDRVFDLLENAARVQTIDNLAAL